MKDLADHAPNCNCDRCSPECGARWDVPGDPDNPHGCMKKAPHKGSHVCCCSDRSPK